MATWLLCVVMQPAAAQDGLSIDRVEILAPAGTLTDPTNGFRIDVDLDQLAGERLIGDGFLILLEPPRAPGDALFGDGFEVQ